MRENLAQFASEEEKARYVRNNFSRIAHRYDLFNDVVTQGQHRLWKRLLVKACGVCPGMRVLDVCCGSGDLAGYSLARMKGQGLLVALDFSPAMLQIAARRLAGRAQRLHTKVLLVEADALRMPFPPGSFQAITIAYGLRNTANLQAALHELRRLLAPGGSLGILDLGRVRIPILRTLFRLYLFTIAPAIGRLLQPGQEMYAYLPASTQTYPTPERLKAMLLSTGFHHVRILTRLWGATTLHIAQAPL